MNTFDLKTYVPQMVAEAEASKCEASEAVERFVANLTTISDFHPFSGGLNFRALGQQWNALGYKVRNSQKAETISLVEKKLLPPPATTKNKRGL